MQSSAAADIGRFLRRALILVALVASTASCATFSNWRTYIVAVSVGDAQFPYTVDIAWAGTEKDIELISGVSNWSLEKVQVLALLSSQKSGIVTLEVVPQHKGKTEFHTRGRPAVMWVFVNGPDMPPEGFVRRFDGDAVIFKHLDIRIDNGAIDVTTR